MKLKKRLQVIASEIEKDDYLADVGCDHAYLGIYLTKNRLCSSVIATEINQGPYNIAINNLIKYDVQFPIYLCDGLTLVKEAINTIVISGMGANTIIDILKNYPFLTNIKKIIIQSNNDWHLIREYLNSKDFTIVKELYLEENNKDYITIVFRKGKENLTKEELLFGKYNPDNIEFYQKTLKKYNNILKEIPNNNSLDKDKISNLINILIERTK